MPIQNAALRFVLFRPALQGVFKLDLPETQDDTVTESLGEGRNYNVRRHGYGRELRIRRSWIKNLRRSWESTCSYVQGAQLIQLKNLSRASLNPNSRLHDSGMQQVRQ